VSRLHRDATKQLTNDIVSGRRAPGDMLQREVDLAHEEAASQPASQGSERRLREADLGFHQAAVMAATGN
jgi:DNA-binding FadR family transcriptional regulator